MVMPKQSEFPIHGRVPNRKFAGDELLALSHKGPKSFRSGDLPSAKECVKRLHTGIVSDP
jgi:hypothetical protein